MTRRMRGSHTPAFKAKVALAAISPKRLRFGGGEKTLAERAQPFDVHPHQITQGRGQLLDGAAGVLGRDKTEAGAAPVDLKSASGSRRFIGGGIRRNPRRATRSIPICCAA